MLKCPENCLASLVFDQSLILSGDVNRSLLLPPNPPDLPAVIRIFLIAVMVSFWSLLFSYVVRFSGFLLTLFLEYLEHKQRSIVSQCLALPLRRRPL